MGDSAIPGVIDGEREVSRDELIASIESRRSKWEAELARAGERVNEPGVAGEWTLRDVVAHINAYYRFHVSNLGGAARSLGEMPQDVGFDMEKRNQWLHEQDRGRSWEFVSTEAAQVADEFLRQLGRRTDDEMRALLVPWHHWPTWRWMCDIRNHYDEHLPALEAWLERRA
jgi:hypothetical protein